MLITNFIKILEICFLGLLFPIIILYFNLSKYILPCLWTIFFYTIILYLFLYKTKFKFTNFFRILVHKKYILLIIIRWIILSFVLYFFTLYFFPQRLFFIQKNDVSLLYKIFIFYPLFSAFPQEFIFCTFFFKRYEKIFRNDKFIIYFSALIFCFAHIFAINWVAPLLSFFGGFIFANTYKKTNSLFVVSLEHSLYGNTLFYLGLGWFFWGGSVEFK